MRSKLIAYVGERLVVFDLKRRERMAVVEVLDKTDKFKNKIKLVGSETALMQFTGLLDK